MEEELKKQYQEKWAPDKYLEEFITVVNPWENKLISSLHDVVENGKIKGPRGVDIGCGPTVHRMSILSRACDELVVCDYAQSNLDFLAEVLEADEPHELVKRCLAPVVRLEERGSEDGVGVLCARLRARVKHIVQVDVTSSKSTNNLLQYGGKFDFAHSSGCLEAACLSEDSFLAALESIASVLKSGAALILSGYLSGSFYTVKNVKFTCFTLNEDLVKTSLQKAGFIVDFIRSWDDSRDACADKANARACFFSLSYKT